MKFKTLSVSSIAWRRREREIRIQATRQDQEEAQGDDCGGRAGLDQVF